MASFDLGVVAGGIKESPCSIQKKIGGVLLLLAEQGHRG